MDLKFEKLSDDLELVQFITIAAVYHMGEIKRGIRLNKERIRIIISNIPFKSLQKQ